MAEVLATAASLGVGDRYALIGPTTGVLTGTVAELHFDGHPVEAVEPPQHFGMKIAAKARRSDLLYRIDCVEK